MRKFAFLLVTMLLLKGSMMFAQQQTGIIEVRKNVGTTFLLNDKKLTPKQLLEISNVNPEAYEKMKIAKTNNDWGTALGFAGGFLIGWPVGTAIAGGEPNWTLLGVGAGLIVVSIPFSIAYTKHAKEAVEIYNKGYNPLGMRKVDFNLGLSANGFGLKATF